MNPDKVYMMLKGKILDEIRLHYLALPKTQINESSHFGYRYVKPHGVELWINPGETFRLKRNIIYQLQEEDALKVLDEKRSDMPYEGTRFIIDVKEKFNIVFKQHDKGVKIVKKLETEGLWVQANFEGEEIHIFIGEKEEDYGKHVHFIIGKTGEVRIDNKDEAPETLVRKVAAITLKDGNKIKATLEFEKNE